MPRWGMVIDLDRCTGCQACVAACQAENNIPFVGEHQAELGRSILWMHIISEYETSGDSVRARFMPRPCYQCENAPCTKVCPVYATHLAEDGLVAQIYHRCIGCRFCMAACPYTAKYFNWLDYSIPEEMRAMHNPDVSLRQNGVVEKCTFCHHRLMRAKDQARYEDRAFDPRDYTTACAQTCPSRAIYVGDLDDLTSEVSRFSRNPRAFRPLEELGTEPKVYYLEEGERIEA